ncbi:MAG: hypothetical protein LBQ21_02610, partial [Clostridiales Family XIII bacterium]|nr:hypothetical protein [Clostridiales Family XIII bacterium]
INDPDANGDGIPDSENNTDESYELPGGGGYDDDGDGIPNINDPDANGDGKPDSENNTDESYELPGGGGHDDDGDGIPNINDPDADGDGIPDSENNTDESYELPGGGGHDDDGDGIPNINDPDANGDGKPDSENDTDESYELPGGGGYDDDGDGIPNINDPDSPCYWLPGGGGVTGGNIYRVITHFGKWSGTGTATARIDADYVKFVALYYSGAKVDRANYTVTEGSTVITLSERYLKTFPDGKYTFIATFTDGYSAEIMLEIDRKGGIKTGDDSGIGISVLTLLLATAGLTGCAITRRRLRKYHIGTKA